MASSIFYSRTESYSYIFSAHGKLNWLVNTGYKISWRAVNAEVVQERFEPEQEHGAGAAAVTEGLFKCQAVKKVNDITSFCFHSSVYHITLQIKLALLRDFFPPITITTCHTSKSKLCFSLIYKAFKCKIKSWKSPLNKNRKRTLSPLLPFPARVILILIASSPLHWILYRAILHSSKSTGCCLAR